MAFAAGTGVSTLVSKSPSKTTVLSGETFRYKIKFTCSGNTAAETCDNVVITDTIASQFSNAPSDVVLDGPATVLASSSFDPASRVVTWTLKSSVEPGTAAELGVSLKFPNGPTPNSTTVTNTANGRNSAGPLVSVSAAPVTAQAADHMTFIKSIGIPTSTLPLDAPVPFNLLICPTGELGSLNAQNVSFTEYLPTGSTYVTGTASPTPTAITSNTLTWSPAAFSTPDVSATGSCRRVRFRLIFPNGAYNLGDTNVNTATVTYTPVGLTVKTLTASVPLTIGLPVADPEIHKTGAGETSIGSNSLIYYNMSVINNGNTDLLNYVVTDTLPGNFQTEAIVRPALVDPDTEITTTVGATVTFWTKNGTCPSGGAFTFSGYPCVIPAADIGQTFRVYTNNPYPSVNPFASNPLLNLTAGNVITQVVWTWKAIPAGYHYDGASVIGNYKTPGWDGSTFAIGSIITNVYGSQSDNAPSTTVTATTVVVTGTSFPVVNKSVLNGSSVIPLDLVTFRLSLTNSPQAAQSITAPMMADLLPPELDFVSFTPWQNDGTQTSSGVYQISGFGASQVNMVTATAPTVSVVQNYSGTGRTLLRFTWGPGVVVLPQHKFVVDIVTQVKPGTTFGTYHNETAYFPAGVDDTRLCETGADNLDLDADSLITDTVCYNTNRTLSAQFTVNKSAVVESRKFVKGELDSNWHFDPEVGRTIQGGTIDYRFMIKNPGNIPLNNIQLVDVLPFVGDVGEVTQSSRGSQWGTVWDSALTIAPVTGTRTAVTSALTSAPITVTAPYTIYYSNSSKPCTDSVDAPDLFNNTAPKPDGCTAPAWSTTFVSATNKSFRVEFDPALTLYGNQQISFDLRVRAPLYAPGATAGGDSTLGNSDDGNVAWNTFGFASKRIDDGTNLAAQPPRVGVEVENFGIGDYVWFDINHNGVQDSGEPGIPNVAVTLFDPAGIFSRTTTTDGNGYYQFDGLINSENYHAVFTPTLGTNLTLPGGLVITLDNTLQWTPSLSGTISADSNVTSSVGIVGTSNEVSVTRSYTASLLTGLPYGIRAQYHNPTLDGGIWMPAKLGNYVWKDTNHDGDQDVGEPPINNLQVDLFENGVLSATTNTNVSGLYTFTQLQPGYVYSVHFALPSLAYSYTWRLNNGSMTNSPTFDTNSNPDWLGDSLTVTLQPGEHNRTVDAGIWGDAGLGDYVWVDLNRNGIQESGESGLGGVVVKLYENGTQTQTYTTDPNGYYGFTHLAPSTSYSVNFTLPNGYSWTLQTIGISTADSNVGINGDTGSVTLGNLEFNPTIDAGVWIPARLGNYVWLDDNADGLQTSGEQGLNGITATLLYSNGVSYVPYPYGPNSTQTANDPSGTAGYYTFTDLISGMYIVQFTLPKGLTFTFPLQGGNNAIDSNVNDIPAGRTGAIVINHGDVNPTIDTGLFTDTVSVGNRVWFDVNDNAQIDTGEVGVDGVRVELYRDSDSSGDFTLGDAFVAYSMTLDGGYYTFTQLAPSMDAAGAYLVVLSNTNFATGGVLAGYHSSNVGVTAPDPDNNIDNDDNGTLNNPLGVVASAPISLNLGLEPTTDGDNSKFTNWSVDFGFYKLELGNFVWEDLNNSGDWDSGEPPVSLLNVHLFKSGVEISQTATNLSGYYTFTNLSAGAYTVSVDLPPLWFSSKDVSTSATPDSNNTDQDDNGVISTGLVTTGLTIASNIITLAGGAEPIVITSTGVTQNPTLDFGIVRYASLGDFVWEDLNHDGLQDSSEPRIAGVTATLYLAGAVQGVTTTDTSGFYFFGNLTPGVLYTLSFALPTAPFGSAPYTWTVRNNAGATISNATTFSDSNVFEDSTTLPVTLRSNQHNPTIDAGVWRPARLGNYVWLDDNHNGLQDELASYGMNGVTVTLYYATALNGSYAPYTYGPSQTQTANDPLSNPGYYTFTDLISGFYYVQFELPNGYTRTLQTTSTITGSDADLDTGVTPPITLNAGDVYPHLDAGLWQPAGLGDYVWEDMNHNGVQDFGEPAMPTVTVQLYENGVLTGTTQTDGSGYYQFVNLFPGANYTVVFDLPAGYDAFTVQNHAGATVSNTTNADDSNADAAGVSQLIVLASGEFNPTIDAGVFKYASLGDQVWFDADKDGLQDVTEPFVPSVLVTLYENGAAGPTTTTDSNGFYEFLSLLPGVPYSVEFTLPAGFTWTQMLTAPSTYAGDSNAYWNGSTDVITLTSGEHDPKIDAGLIAPNALGNYVWVDDNYDGLQTEPITRGVNGVTVTLMYLSGTGYIPYPYGVNELLTADDLGGNPGYYTFTNLFPGTYQVQFDLPSGYAAYQFTQQNNDPVTGSDVNGSGRTADVVMAADTINPDVDAGIWQTANLGDYVWEDLNHDGLQDKTEPPVAGVTVTLYAPSGRTWAVTDTTQTDASGLYTFSNLLPGVSYYVHFDLPSGYHYSNPVNSGDPNPAYDDDSNPDVVTGNTPVIMLSSGEHNPTIDAGLWRGAGLGDYVWFDLDRNGTQDPTEPGVSGVTVTLYENGVVSGSVQTGPDGGYTFGGLTPGVPYSVSFELPNGYEFTLPLNEGAGVYSDSNASPVDGSTQPVTLASNEYDPSIDAGVWAKLALGNRVWLDTNNDGQLNNGEVGVDQVTVELYRDSDSNGVYTPGFDVLADTITTSEGGYYTFTNLLPVGYIVVLPQSNFVADGALYGYHSSTPTAATPNDDVNNNDDGVETGTAMAVQYVASRVISLIPGTEPTNDEAPVEDFNASGDWNSNYSVDFGFYKLTLGNGVWEDINNDGRQNNGEPSLSNVSVMLYNAAGTTVISTTQTDANGYYTFAGMLADNYIVGVTPLAGYVSSTGAGQEADPDSNGDANDNGVTTRSNGEIRSAVFTLSAGADASRPNNIVDNTSATTANPTVDFGLWRPAGLGDRVWFDVNHNGAQDAGETGVGNVRVWLVDGNGTRIMTTTTNATGIYTFSNLISGTYSVQFDLSTLPAGRLVTVQDAGSNDIADSDANVTTGATQQVVLFPGDVNPTLDMGVWQPAGLGDYVWHDLNGNGQQDAGEPGVPNVTVTLYTPNGPLTTQTNASGYYSFTNLVPGVIYTLNFGLPSGYSYTLQTQGASATDSNVNMAGNTGSITLQPGEFNQMIDAGVVQLAQLGNYVWLDVNQNGKQDVTEQVVPSVTVTLYVGGQPIVTTTTDANGIYTFTNLRPGVPYVVGFTAPSGMAWTVPNVTGNDVNSDANGSGMTAPVVLTSGETNLTLDAGLRPGLVLEKIAITSGPNNTVGKDQVITYTIRITNTTSVAMVSVVVTDPLPSGLEFVAGTSTPAQVSENPLKWQFNAVLPGESKVIVFRAKVVPGTASLLTNVAYVMGGPISGIVASDDASAISDPTAIALASFSAKAEGNGVRIGWSTSLEQDTYGFHLYRSTSENRGEAIRVTSDLIVANGRNGGASYEFVDTSAEANKTYSYWLQETELSGVTHEYGPVSTAQAVGGQPSAVTNATLQPVLTGLAGGVPVVPQGQTVAQVQQVQIAAGATQEQGPTFASGPSAVKTELVVKADTVNVPAVNAVVAPVPNVGVAAAVIAPALANDVVSAAPANDDVQVAAPAQVDTTESIAQPAPMQTAGVQVMTGASTQKTVLGIVKPSTASAQTQPQMAAKRDMPVNAGLIAGLIGLVALLGVGTGLVIRKRNRSKGSK